MREEIRLTREAGRRYAAAAGPSFPIGMTERGAAAAWREYVRVTPSIAPHFDQFERAVRGREEVEA